MNFRPSGQESRILQRDVLDFSFLIKGQNQAGLNFIFDQWVRSSIGPMLICWLGRESSSGSLVDPLVGPLVDPLVCPLVLGGLFGGSFVGSF